ncbi:helix-turn-helix domain-containing protein [Bartonella tribocorum]|uniref:Transcriptional regulator n=1 Tax=Bartonella tribocorum TaxID=85701 RepID=A0A2M6UQM3_9HYPH|nr:helix-turn-helix transcriptional regulator [Bartonella tribocorum]PIT68485.1 transcriptional regulator [Bartonella tribocorum]
MPTRNPDFPTKNPSFIDVSIGKRIRYRRIAMGLSQKALGSTLRVSFQQIQKYEKGLNRVSAKCLLEIAQKLQVPIGFFYADLLATDLATKEDLASRGNPSHCNQNISSEKEYLLLKNFRELKPKKQKAILCLLSD